MQDVKAIIGRFGLLAFVAVATAGCSIKNDVPGFEYPAQAEAENKDWPKLVVTEELIRLAATTTAEVGDSNATTDQLEARAIRLRARARALASPSGN